jgi:hypothetical protein
MAVRSTQEALQISALAGSAKVRSTQEVLQISITAPIMTIIYPLNPPNIAGLGPQTVKFTMIDLVGETVSPFTGGQQEQQWPGNWFEIEVSLPPMLRAQAEQWIAWLGALHGKFGTFLMGDYNAPTPQGTALGAPTVAGGTNVNGASQLVTAGWTPGATLKAGDYLQLQAAGQPKRLHKNLLDAGADGGGNMTLQIFPNIRETLAGGSAILTSNTVGTFRLAENPRVWTLDRMKAYAITFKAKEAI